ncbi:MAG: DUF4202 domain-containing protein, partial [Myxococcota bacterium]|nr:DUF4202 domain-containing protein [Myxococcota bacterium]
WELPRSAHPPGRAGYLRWRAEAARRHAARVSTLLAEEGAPPEAIDRVRALVLKRDLRTDPEAQALEDCACLVFLEHEAAEFAAGRNEASVVDILVKTLRKMSPRARALAPGLPLQPEVRAVLERALAASDGSDGAR